MRKPVQDLDAASAAVQSHTFNAGVTSNGAKLIPDVRRQLNHLLLMEHLFYLPEDYEGPKLALEADVLTAECHASAHEFEPVDILTPWLGFEHDPKSTQPFRTYCQTSGWTLAKIWDGQLRQSHGSLSTLSADQIVGRVAALLQSWLYFGLLEAFLGKKVEVSYMTKQLEDSSTILYSKNLCHALQGRVFQLRLSTDDVKSEFNHQIGKDLSLAHDWIRHFTAWSVETFRLRMEASYPGFMNLVGIITPAIVRLAEALECTCIEAIPYFTTVGTHQWSYPYFVAEHRRQMLLKLGWCPFTIKLLEETTNQSLMDWIVSKEKRYPMEGHGDCSPIGCIRNHIDEWSYVQSHAFSDCKCTKLRPQINAIPAILKQDRIPLVHVGRNGGDMTIEVTNAPLKTPSSYVAISHVWVDGLGGSTETGLHQCQALRLQALASQLLANSAAGFWMDTLCIPQLKEYRTAAILQMRRVYQNAAAVLVIDKSIQTCKKSASTEEILLTIYTSAWMQRMWTYQEAVLAKRLFFVLEDGLWENEIITVPDMRPSVAVVWRCLAVNLYRLRTDQSAINVGHVYMALRWRNTSRREDELLVVSTLLQAESRELFEAKGEERMKLLWLTLKNLPYNIPLLDGPKLSFPGFKWAPKTFMHQSSIKLHTQSVDAKSLCTKEGLVGDYLTVRLEKALHGNRDGHGKPGYSGKAMFHVYVHGDVVPQTWDDKAHCVLRIHCAETWPKDPLVVPFDMLLFGGGNTRPDSGQWWPAAALLSRQDVQLSEPPCNGDKVDDLSSALMCDYVGRLALERIHIDELANDYETVMSFGWQKTFINAAGVWSEQRLCIQ